MWIWNRMGKYEQKNTHKKKKKEKQIKKDLGCHPEKHKTETVRCFCTDIVFAGGIHESVWDLGICRTKYIL